MIRLNASFTLTESANMDEILKLGVELVLKSRLDAGCVAYDLLISTTEPRTFMFCETWQDDASLAAHSAAAHFTRIVPLLEEASVSGLKLDRFEF